jgi:hypothetical protein
LSYERDQLFILLDKARAKQAVLAEEANRLQTSGTFNHDTIHNAQASLQTVRGDPSPSHQSSPGKSSSAPDYTARSEKLRSKKSSERLLGSSIKSSSHLKNVSLKSAKSLAQNSKSCSRS